ncbi:MAG: hypothetical protein K6E21_03470 [Bacilli bacterium]|nr:hypothetical protein [Bacilli bacterium]
MGISIIELGELTPSQKEEAVELFLEGFGKFMTFSKNVELKKKLFIEIFDPKLFLCFYRRDE